jgi:hypothetical protein
MLIEPVQFMLAWMFANGKGQVGSTLFHRLLFPLISWEPLSTAYKCLLEPMSKSSEEDNEAGELDKAEEVLSVVLPADEYATLPLYPGEEALDEPASHVTA